MTPAEFAALTDHHPAAAAFLSRADDHLDRLDQDRREAELHAHLAAVADDPDTVVLRRTDLEVLIAGVPTVLPPAAPVAAA